MNILITGATGFIGRNLVKKLLNEDHNIFCILQQNTKNPFDEKIVKSILLDEESIASSALFFTENNIEGIIHLASYVLSGNHHSCQIGDIIDSNIKFGTFVLEAAVKSNVKWFINTGTYWQNFQNENYSPVNLYAASKQAFEDMAKFYYETSRLNFCTLRLFDTYGRNDTRPKIFNLWSKIAETGEVLNMSPGEQIIDISYIDDIVDAFSLLIDYLHNDSPLIQKGDVFFLKSPDRYSLKELSSIFENVTSSKLNIQWGGRAYKEREIMNPYDKGKTIPNFHHKVSIEEGLTKSFKINKL